MFILIKYGFLVLLTTLILSQVQGLGINVGQVSALRTTLCLCLDVFVNGCLHLSCAYGVFDCFYTMNGREHHTYS